MNINTDIFEVGTDYSLGKNFFIVCAAIYFENPISVLSTVHNTNIKIFKRNTCDSVNNTQFEKYCLTNITDTKMVTINSSELGH